MSDRHQQVARPADSRAPAVRAASSASIGAAPLDQPAGTRPRLYTRPFLVVCTVAFLGFSQNFLIGPILPLLVLDMGGDAALVGLVVAAFSLPSVVLRPFIGRAADRWSTRGTWAIGTAVVAVSGFLYLIPSTLVLLGVRIFHGAGWAGFNTGSSASVARLAPASRRGEASSFYNLMPGIAQTVMPGIGLAVVASAGFPPALLIAALAGLLAIVVLIASPIPEPPPPPATPEDGAWRTLLERGAILPMAIEALFTSAYSLFFIYVPLFGIARGIPVTDIALYYPVYGVVFVVARLGLGRYSDRIGRRRLFVLGVASAIVGLLIALAATDVVGITLAGCAYGIGAAVVSPNAMALAIDRARPGRSGAAMATYTLGFQLAAGAGAAIWGLVIDASGFGLAFALGLGVEVALLGLLLARWNALAQIGSGEGGEGGSVTGR